MLHLLHLFTVFNLKLKRDAGFLDLGDVLERGLDLVNMADGRGQTLVALAQQLLGWQ